MAAREYTNYVTCHERTKRFKEAGAKPELLAWAEKREAEAELLATAERIVLVAEAGMGLRR